MINCGGSYFYQALEYRLDNFVIYKNTSRKQILKKNIYADLKGQQEDTLYIKPSAFHQSHGKH